jgi:hypothetical protein
MVDAGEARGVFLRDATAAADRADAGANGL